MSLLSELSAIAKRLKIPAQTSVYSGKAPDEYLVFTPLYDSFELHADNAPTADVQEVRISLFTKGNYTRTVSRLGGFIMREFWNTIQLIFTAVGGWLGWFLGGSDGLLYALIAFVVIDYITGVMCAISDKKLSSAVGFKGICRKVLIFALVGGGHILDTRVIGAGSVLRTAVIFFYLSNEGISLLENAAHLGLPVPKKLKDVLEQLHKRSEKEDNDED